MRNKIVAALVLAIVVQLFMVFRFAGTFTWKYAKYGYEIAEAIVEIEIWFGGLILLTTSLIITVQLLGLALLYERKRK